MPRRRVVTAQSIIPKLWHILDMVLADLEARYGIEPPPAHRHSTAARRRRRRLRELQRAGAPALPPSSDCPRP